MEMQIFNVGDKVKCGKYKMIVQERINPELDKQYGDTYYRLSTKKHNDIYRFGKDLTKTTPSLISKIISWIANL